MSKKKINKFIIACSLKNKNRRIVISVYRAIKENELIFILRTRRLVNFKAREITKYEMILSEETFYNLGYLFGEMGKDEKFIEAIKTPNPEEGDER